MFSSDLDTGLEALGRECIEKFGDTVPGNELKHDLAARYHPSFTALINKDPSFERTLRSLATFRAAVELMNSTAFRTVIQKLPLRLDSGSPEEERDVFSVQSLTEMVVISGQRTTRPSAVFDEILATKWLDEKIEEWNTAAIIDQSILSFVAAVLKPGIDNKIWLC